MGWPDRRTRIEIVLKDGRVLRGKEGKVASLADKLQASAPDSGAPLQLIVFLDDNLRRTYFSDRLVREVRQEENRQARREVRHSPAGASLRLGGPRRRPAGAHRAVRRVRPAHLHDQHGHGDSRTSSRASPS